MMLSITMIHIQLRWKWLKLSFTTWSCAQEKPSLQENSNSRATCTFLSNLFFHKHLKAKFNYHVLRDLDKMFSVSPLAAFIQSDE